MNRSKTGFVDKSAANWFVDVTDFVNINGCVDGTKQMKLTVLSKLSTMSFFAAIIRKFPILFARLWRYVKMMPAFIISKAEEPLACELKIFFVMIELLQLYFEYFCSCNLTTEDKLLKMF